MNLSVLSQFLLPEIAEREEEDEEEEEEEEKAPNKMAMNIYEYLSSYSIFFTLPPNKELHAPLLRNTPPTTCSETSEKRDQKLC